MKNQPPKNTPARFVAPDGSTITVSLQTITPAMAERWLAGQTRNRKLKRRHLDVLKRDMKRGDWAFTADGIAFDASGALINGQHRLTGICETGVSLPMFVFEGFAPAAQDSMDMGAARTVWEQWGMEGVTNASVLVAYVNIIARTLLGARNKVSLPQARALLQHLKHLPAAAKANEARQEFRSAAYLGPLALALHLPGKTKDVAEFFDQFTLGLRIAGQDAPAQRLRAYARKNYCFGGKAAGAAASYTLDCLECFIAGRTMPKEEATGTGAEWLTRQMPELLEKLKAALRE